MMAVEILFLRGCTSVEAADKAESLMDLRTGPADLSKLLVVDDTSLLAGHAAVFRRLSSGRRVDTLLCVAAGPRPAQIPQPPLLPDSLAGPHGPGVLWVGDPDGIDWQAGPGGRILGRRRGPVDGLARLIELLRVEAVFDAVWDAFEYRVPHRVASPGLRLVGADDEAAMFKAALVMGIEQITAVGSGNDEPFRSLTPELNMVALAPDSPLAASRARVTSAVAEAAAEAARVSSGIRLFRRGDGDLEGRVREVGAALGKLRAEVIQLLRVADAKGGLTSDQRETLLEAGLRFAPDPPTASGDTPDEQDPARSPSFRAITEAIDGGDTLPLIRHRLTETAKEARCYGSAAYLPQVDTACPPALPAALAAVTEIPATVRRGGPAAARRELRLDEAERAGAGLVTLVQRVAGREWAPAVAEPDELDRARIALTGIQNALGMYAVDTPRVGAARLVRLSESLLPVLRALVRLVLLGEYETPGATGQDTLATAQRRTKDHLQEWVDLVQAHGLDARPKFAPLGADEVPYTVQDDLARIREALLADPRGQMWQLCGQDDVTALSVVQEPLAVRFAPRQEERELGKAVPRDTIWLFTGSQAGLLRLVPLHTEAVTGDLPYLKPSFAEPE